MCAREHTTAAVSGKAAILLEHLESRVEADGECYLKSRFIADEIELSAKEIGAYMRRLRDVDCGLEIEKWGYTNGTTWRVQTKQNGSSG